MEKFNCDLCKKRNGKPHKVPWVIYKKLKRKEEEKKPLFKRKM